MTSLVGLSPLVVDQSFPRTRDELQAVAIALGELEQLISLKKCVIVFTGVVCDFVEMFEWEKVADYPLLLEIHRLLGQLILRQGTASIRVDLSSYSAPYPHPIPESCSDDGLCTIWQDEMGRLLAAHDISSTDAKFFIGIICERSCSGDGPGQYSNPDGRRCFPLVGPIEIDGLTDAWEWIIAKGDIRADITVDLAAKNLKSLGAVSITPPRRGSHYKVTFPNARPWTLDPNADPVPDAFLRELVPIAKYPYDVIRYVLLHGVFPQRRLRLPGR